MIFGKKMLLLDELGKWVEDKDYNPFKIPPDCDMFLIRDQERKNAQKKRKEEREAAVHEKHTHASRINHLTAQVGFSSFSDWFLFGDTTTQSE